MNRAGRRRQLREDEKRIARGIDVRRIDRPDIVALLRALDNKVQLSIQRKSVTPLMELLYANVRSAARSIDDVTIACRQGCSHCCHSWVDATPAEVLFAVKRMGAAQLVRAKESVERMSARTAGLSFDERAEMVTPCPLLEAGSCSIYESRPIVCRAAASADAEICERVYLGASGEGVPVPMVWRSLGLGYAVALEGAILHAGLVPIAREWNESLRTALRESDAEARWLAGEDVFRDAPRASTSGSFENPLWAEVYYEAFGERPSVTR